VFRLLAHLVLNAAHGLIHSPTHSKPKVASQSKTFAIHQLITISTCLHKFQLKDVLKRKFVSVSSFQGSSFCKFWSITAVSIEVTDF